MAMHATKTKQSVLPSLMADDFNHDFNRRRAPEPSATSPPPAGAGDCPPIPASHAAIARTGRLPMSAPSGRNGWPENLVKQYGHAKVGSPSTPPEYYVRRATTGRPPANGVARAAAAALASNRDRQPLLTADTYTVPLHDGTVSPMHYCMTGLVLVSLCAAVALVVVGVPGMHATTHDVRPEAAYRERRPRLPSYDQVGRNAVVVTPRPEEQSSPGVQGSTVFGPLQKPGNSADTTVSPKDDAAQHAVTISSLGVEGHARHGCNQYYYTYCTRPTANRFHYDPEQMACVPTTKSGAQLCNRGINRFSSWERCRDNCLQPGRVSDMCFESVLFMPCSRQDFVEPLWYFNGTTCTKWTFPDGHYPSGQCGVFGTFDQCLRLCVVHNGTSNSSSAGCEVPSSGKCRLELLRYPFFADMQAKGSARCVNASGVTLARRCLVGNNQFESLMACQKACMGKTMSFGTQLPPVQ
ncbi:uncharacterized protein [Dermacentor albipictus]|uniref:uncharacterized protein n=1 Tax=Dermacentor albipictus TaxID=60249 RepID=UPI0031FDD515